MEPNFWRLVCYANRHFWKPVFQRDYEVSTMCSLLVSKDLHVSVGLVVSGWNVSIRQKGLALFLAFGIVRMVNYPLS